MGANLESLEKAIRELLTTNIVSCPFEPVAIPGSSSSGAYIANDAMGRLVQVKVPKRGVIVSATLFDLDYEKKQIDLEIFKYSITQVTSEDAWTCSDADMVKFVVAIAFAGFDDHAVNATSEVNNIGKAYTAPLGILWVQAVTRGAPTIAVGSEPRFQLQIQSFDPTFKES